MKTKLVHCQKENYDVLIDRRTKWGNPYSLHHTLTLDEAKYLGAVHREGGSITRADAIALYEWYLRNNQELLNDLESLRGLTLGCWCKPQACHGDVILKLLDETEDKSDLFEY